MKEVHYLQLGESTKMVPFTKGNGKISLLMVKVTCIYLTAPFILVSFLMDFLMDKADLSISTASATRAK